MISEVNKEYRFKRFGILFDVFLSIIYDYNNKLDWKAGKPFQIEFISTFRDPYILRVNPNTFQSNGEFEQAIDKFIEFAASQYKGALMVQEPKKIWNDEDLDAIFFPPKTLLPPLTDEEVSRKKIENFQWRSDRNNGNS